MALLNNFNRNDFINFAVEKFVEGIFAGDSITEIKNTIAQTEIKNALSSTFGKVPKFNLKISDYVYDELIYFPNSDISYETFTTNKFFYKCSSFNKSKIPPTSFAHNRKNTWIRSWFFQHNCNRKNNAWNSSYCT